MIKRYLPGDVQRLVRWYERYISPLSLIAGFMADNFFLTRRVDLWQTNALLGAYLVIAGAGMLLCNAITAGRMRGAWALASVPLIPVGIQFAFGGLFSGYLSLYGRSADFVGSWVFVAAIATLLIGNERFMRLYTRVPFQLSLYFVALYSFFIFFLPVIFHRIDVAVFVAAGAVSVLVLSLFMALMFRVAPALMRQSLLRSVQSIVLIFTLFNVFYAFNIIPPLPLSLKEAGVYHRVARVADGSYQVLAEPVPWYRAFLRYNTVFHLVPGDDIYAFSAIFAPAGIATPIVYEWQYNDGGTWKTVSTISFTISGGRDGGYRSYSILSHAAAGSWRVTVLTPDGRIIGRIPFTVQLVADAPALVIQTK